MYNLHSLDLAIIGIYLIICLVLGVVNVKGINNIRDYAIGGSYIKTPLLVATLFATHIGGGATIGAVEKIYSMGLIFGLIILLNPIMWLTTSYVFSKRITEFKEAGCISLSDIMEYLYGAPGRWVTNIAAKLMAIAVTAMQILAIGYLLSYFTGISQMNGALIGFGVLVIYSVLGGIRAVVATDALQSAVLYIGIPAACFAGYYDVGGYDKMLEVLPASHLSFDPSFNNLCLFATLAIWCWEPHSHGTFMQRFLMANSKAQLKQTFKVLFFGSFPISFVLFLIAYIVKIKAPDINPNLAFFYLIDNYLPIGIKGLVITGILAAIMSTADSWLNTVSVLWAHDIIKKLVPSISDKQELLIARIALIATASLAAFLAFYKNESVLSINWIASSFWTPLILVPLVLGFLNFETTYKSFIASSICGILFSLMWAHMEAKGTNDPFIFDTGSISIGILGSLVGLLSTHYYYKFKTALIPAQLPAEPQSNFKNLEI